MSRTGVATLALLALVASVFTASGCGSSAEPSNQSSVTSHGSTQKSSKSDGSTPLSVAQLISKGDAICYRLNAKRRIISIGGPEDYERLIVPLAAYERTAATEMENLTPPPSLAHAWQQIVLGTQTLARLTGHFHTYAEASNLKLSRPFDAELGRAMDQVTRSAKQAGFKDCSRFT